MQGLLHEEDAVGLQRSVHSSLWHGEPQAVQCSGLLYEQPQLRAAIDADPASASPCFYTARIQGLLSAITPYDHKVCMNIFCSTAVHRRSQHHRMPDMAPSVRCRRMYVIRIQ